MFQNDWEEYTVNDHKTYHSDETSTSNYTVSDTQGGRLFHENFEDGKDRSVCNNGEDRILQDIGNLYCP